jgi:hypothetical protein
MDEAWLTAAAVGFFGSLAISIVLWWFDSPSTRIRRYVDGAHPDDRKYLKDILGGAPAFVRYALAIRALNERFDGWFGPRWSGRAFVRCLQLAIAYPVILLLLAWLISGEGAIGTRSAFEETGDFADRWWPAVLIGAAIAAIVVAYFNLNRLRRVVKTWIASSFAVNDSKNPNIIRNIEDLITASLFGILAGVAGGSGAFAGAGSITFALTLGFYCMVIDILGYNFTIVVFSAVAYAVAVVIILAMVLVPRITDPRSRA